MKALFILNAPAYGSEQTYNALRLAAALAKREHNDVRVYLMGDAVVAAKRGQKVAEGFYNLELMLDKVSHGDASRIGVCGGCMDARALETDELVTGSHRGTLEALADWSEWADKVFVF